jgi:hypothetical protein
MFNIRKILMFLNVIQFTKELPSHKMYMVEKRRLNPFNPLSYLTLIIAFFVGIILFGVIGFWNEVDLNNPFKWK